MPEQKKQRTVKCPTCSQSVLWSTDNPFRPFCSERCKQIDLGAWASESYRVPAALPPDSAIPHTDEEDSE